MLYFELYFEQYYMKCNFFYSYFKLCNYNPKPFIFVLSKELVDNLVIVMKNQIKNNLFFELISTSIRDTFHFI